MKRVLFGVLYVAFGLLLGSGFASAQCTRIIQNGTVQNNAPVVWISPCVIGQAGPSGGSSGNPVMLNDFGVQGRIGILDAPNTGQYHSATLGWSPTVTGEFDITLNGFGGANAASSAFIINGSKFAIPGSLAANVIAPTSPFPVSGNMALWNGSTNLKDAGAPPILGPTATTVGDCAFFNNTTGTLLSNRPCFATSTSALGSIQANSGQAVVVASSSAPPVTYIATAAACSFFDGGYCFTAAPGGGFQSWVISPQKTYDPRWWGIANNATMNFYANASAGNDYSGTNLCVKVTIPCATIGQVITSAMSFCVPGQQEVINLTAGAYGILQVNGTPVCAGGQKPGGGGNFINVVGVGSTTTITDPCSPSCVLFSVEASQAAAVGVSNLQINAPSGDDAIFVAGAGVTFVLGNGVTINGSPGSFAAMHIEGPNRIIQAKTTSDTITGTFTNISNNTLGANATFAGTIVCSATTFTGTALLGANYGSTFYLNFSDFHTCPNTLSTYRLAQDSSAVIGNALLPTGAPPPILVAKSTTDQQYTPCVGGAGGCPVATAPTGFGTGATFLVNITTQDSTAWGGQVNITAGTAPSSSGTIWLSSPVLLQTVARGAEIACVPSLANTSGGTAWPNGTYVSLGSTSVTGGTNFRMDWNSNGTNLTATNVYSLNYACSD